VGFFTATVSTNTKIVLRLFCQTVLFYSSVFFKEAQFKFLGRHTGESPEGSSVALQ
jgi:hypothetical protein